MVAVGLLLVGLVALVAGAELLVRGASSLAAAAGVSPLAIGLTVVAYGTSAPEVAVSIEAALAGQGPIALGNVVGSNTCNVLLILGLSAVVAPLAVSSQLVRIDVPLLIGVSLAVLAMAWDGSLGAADGALLLLGAVGYTAFQLVLARRERTNALREDSPEHRSYLAPIALVVVGLALLVLGSGWLVDGAVRLATAWGVSELVIGLTIVALGTSLPELVTSVVATVRGERDIAVGNVIGSNVFNLTAVLGSAACVAKGGLPIADEALRFDLPVMVAVSLICLPVFLTGRAISRAEGATFLVGYAGYVAYLIAAAR